MSRVIDFDAFRAERQREPVLFKIGGQEYQLASSIPASVALSAVALKAAQDDGAEVPLSVITDTGVALFGKDVWHAILTEHQVTLDELGPLVAQVLNAYAPTPTDPQAASTGQTKGSSSPS